MAILQWTATIVLETNVCTKFEAILCMCLCSNSNRFFIVAENSSDREYPLRDTAAAPSPLQRSLYASAKIDRSRRNILSVPSVIPRREKNIAAGKLANFRSRLLDI